MTLMKRLLGASAVLALGTAAALADPAIIYDLGGKNDKSFNISGWLNDTVEQAKRLDDAVPALVVKRKGKGEKALGDSYVVMRLDDLIALLQEAQYS